MLRSRYSLEESLITVPDREAEGTLFWFLAALEDGFGTATAPFVARVVGVDLGQHAGQPLARCDVFRSSVFEEDDHLRMPRLEPAVDDEFGLGFRVCPEELVELDVRVRDVSPDVELPLRLRDCALLFQNAFLLLGLNVPAYYSINL